MCTSFSYFESRRNRIISGCVFCKTIYLFITLHFVTALIITVTQKYDKKKVFLSDFTQSESTYIDILAFRIVKIAISPLKYHFFSVKCIKISLQTIDQCVIVNVRNESVYIWNVDYYYFSFRRYL